MNFREYLNEGNVVDWLGRKLKVKTTKRKPTKNDAPKWAKYLGKTDKGAFHWLSDDTPHDKPNSNKYFPDAKRVEFSGFVGDNDGKGYVEKL